MRWIAMAVAAVVVAGCAMRTVQQDAPVYEGATKMNMLSVGMTKQQVIQTLGVPATTSARGGIECMQYLLLEHSANYSRTSPDSYYVMLMDGKTIEYGKDTCDNLTIDNAIKRNAGAKFDTLSIGMTFADFKAAIPQDPITDGTKDKSGKIICYNYRFKYEERYAAFEAGRLIKKGQGSCSKVGYVYND